MSKSRLLSVLLVSIIMLVAVLGISACVDVTPEPVVHVITFDSNGGSPVETLCTGGGLTVAKPADPTKEGYEFLGWFLGETKYNFDTPVTEDITLIAHWQAKAPVVTHTVTFDSFGGSAVPSQTVEDGKLAVKPENPTKEGYNFLNWYNGSAMYDFSTPVTSDITLEADWEEKQYQVTFDTDGGNNVQGKLVTFGAAIERPENPAKEGYYFEGWFVNDVKYDFSTPISKELTIKAKWSSVTEVDNAFLAALSADYSNYTSEAVYADAEASYMDTYKKADNYAYYFTVNDWDDKGAHDDHFVVYNSNGSVLAMYRLDNNNQWVLSTVSHTEFTLALNWQSVSLEDVYYDEGVYRVYDESITAIVYALFLRSNVVYDDLSFTVKDGHIHTIVGHIGETEQLQLFTDFGETEIEMPAIPAVTVSIQTKNREVEEGAALNLDELITFMFDVKAEGKEYAITADMVDFGTLNFANPQVGEYTVTLSFDTWDGETHTKTAKVVIKAKSQENLTFAQIFAKDYSNVTMSVKTSATATTLKTIKCADNVYNTSTPDAYAFLENDGNLAVYQMVSGSYQPKTWLSLIRVDMLFALSSELFEQEDDSNVYKALNKSEILPIITKMLSSATCVVDETKDYSIALTISSERVIGILIQCSYKTKPTATTPLSFYWEATLDNFGATEIEIPQSIQDMRNTETAEQTAYIDDKKYVA